MRRTQISGAESSATLLACDAGAHRTPTGLLLSSLRAGALGRRVGVFVLAVGDPPEGDGDDGALPSAGLSAKRFGQSPPVGRRRPPLFALVGVSR
ncbi:hypothetical protein [Streptomyces scabiei]|uniref:hypothetical protein n=1 Tax=Streptomyces scabiei TaxID=1930 RepID=UPI001C501A82|nr:hypothetical protein [Streptomyces scabiei]MDX3618472.1 hypothetical protein [Streptomyces europaeiscabiei]